jgi:hypothetical protein
VNLRRAAIGIATAALAALAAAADTSGAVLAAPGDCAQPLGDLVTQRVYGQSAGVAGPASDHFAPHRQPVGVLPLDLTRIRSDPTTRATAGGVVGLVQTAGDGVASAVEGTSADVSAAGTGLIDTAIGATGGVTATILPNEGALGSAATGVDSLGGRALGAGTGAVGTLTGAVKNTLGGL